MDTQPGCPLCEAPGGILVFEGERFRVIRAEEAGFPAFWRLVWTAHVAEFSDLEAADRARCMEAVAAIEGVVRKQLLPDKMNLATLGNVVPHLHWHVIARWHWDSRFPAPVWASVQRPDDEARLEKVRGQLPATDAAILEALVAGSAQAPS